MLLQIFQILGPDNRLYAEYFIIQNISLLLQTQKVTFCECGSKKAFFFFLIVDSARGMNKTAESSLWSTLISLHRDS